MTLSLSKQQNLKVYGSLKANIAIIQLRMSQNLFNAHHVVTKIFKWHLSPFATGPFIYAIGSFYIRKNKFL